MTVEAPDVRRQKDETSALFAYRVALINFARFTPPTVANQEERSDRTKRTRPTFAARNEYFAVGESVTTNVYEIYRKHNRWIGGDNEIGSEEEICLNVSVR